MKRKDDIREELEKLAPTLGRMEIKNNFPIPGNYFYDLSDKIQKKVLSRQEERFSFILRIIHSTGFRYVTGILIIITVSIGLLLHHKHKETEILLGNIPITEEYVLENVDADVIIDYSKENSTLKSSKNKTRTENKILREELENSELESIDENLLIDQL